MSIGIGYSRCSTNRQERSIGEQHEALKRYADGLGLSDVRHFDDEGISGSEMSRPGFDAMLDFCERSGPEYTHVLIWDRDRLARPDNPLEALVIEKAILDTGKSLIYVSTGKVVESTTADLIVAAVDFDGTGKYLRNLSNNVVRGMVKLANAGYCAGGVTPYGYDRAIMDAAGTLVCTIRTLCDGSKTVTEADGRVRTIEPGHRYMKDDSHFGIYVLGDPLKQEAVKRLYADYAANKGGFVALAAQLTREGAPPPGLRGWQAGTIAAMLKNPVYTGAMVFNRKTASKFSRLVEGGYTVEKTRPRKGEKKAKVSPNPEKDHIIKRDCHPALVSPELFARVQAMRAERRSEHHNGETIRGDYLLSKLVFCSACGVVMYGVRVKRKDRAGVVNYLCGSYHRHGKTVCTHNFVSQEALDDLVLAKVREDVLRGLTPDDEEGLIKTLQESFSHECPSPEVTPAKLRADIRAIEDQLAFIVRNLSDENLEAARPAMKELQEEKIGLEKRLSHAVVEGPEPKALAEQAVRLLKAFLRAGDNGPVEQVKALVRRLVKKVTLHFDVQPSASGKTKRSVFAGGDIEVYSLQEAVLADSNGGQHGPP